MNKASDTYIDTDLHCLDLRFASTRLQSPQMVNAMMHSIDRSGQLTPVAAIESGNRSYILMDGYLRIAALRRLCFDTVHLTLWDCDEVSELLRVLSGTQAHPWAAIEEARTIRMLMQQFDLSETPAISDRHALLLTAQRAGSTAITSGICCYPVPD